MMRVDNLLVPFEKIQRLALNRLLLPKHVDKGLGQISVFKLGDWDPDVILSGGIVLQIKGQSMCLYMNISIVVSRIRNRTTCRQGQ